MSSGAKNRATLQAMEAIIPEIANGYSGPSILVPPADKVARAMGVSPQRMNHGGSFEGKLELITGLDVVHEGIVLGSPANLVSAEAIPDRVEALAAQIGSLTDMEQMRLMARLAVTQSTNT